MEIAAGEIYLKEYFEVGDVLDARVVMGFKPKETDGTFEFIISDQERYDPEKFWEMNNLLQELIEIAQEDA